MKYDFIPDQVLKESVLQQDQFLPSKEPIFLWYTIWSRIKRNHTACELFINYPLSRTYRLIEFWEMFLKCLVVWINYWFQHLDHTKLIPMLVL